MFYLIKFHKYLLLDNILIYIKNFGQIYIKVF